MLLLLGMTRPFVLNKELLEFAPFQHLWSDELFARLGTVSMALLGVG